jgi:hypothetical protein
MTVHERLDKYKASYLLKVGSQTHDNRLFQRGMMLKLRQLRLRKNK